MNKPPSDEQIQALVQCEFTSPKWSMYIKGAKQIRDQWKAANESVVERLIDLHMKLNLATTPEAMTEIRNEVKQLIKELTASGENGPRCKRCGGEMEPQALKGGHDICYGCQYDEPENQ